MRLFFLLYSLLVFFFAIPTLSYAGTSQINEQVCCSNFPTIKINKRHHWYIDLGLGWVFNTKDYNVYVNEFNSRPDLYLPNRGDNNINFALSSGYNWFFEHDWLPAASLGIEYSYIPQTNNNGQIEQYSNPDFINYDYSYKTQHNSLSLLGKLDIYRWNQVMPFVLVGIGNSWNDIQSYQEAALPGVSPRINPSFSNGSRSSWKYTLGFGFDYQPIQNLLLALSYRYDGFNRGASGTGFGTFANDRVHNKSYASSLMFNVRYLFA